MLIIKCIYKQYQYRECDDKVSWEIIKTNRNIQNTKSEFSISITKPSKAYNAYRIIFNFVMRIYLYDTYGEENLMNSKIYYKSMIDAEKKLIGIQFSQIKNDNDIPIKFHKDKTKGGETLFANCTNMINTIQNKCGKLDVVKMKSIPVHQDENDNNLLIFSFEPYIIK